MPIDINAVLEDFINPPVPEKRSFFKKKRDINEVKFELRGKHLKGQAIKDFLKTAAWQDIWRPKIVEGLKSQIGTLLRPSSLTMTETEIKSILAKSHVYLGMIADMRYIIDEGEEAGSKLAEMDKK